MFTALRLITQAWMHNPVIRTVFYLLYYSYETKDIFKDHLKKLNLPRITGTFHFWCTLNSQSFQIRPLICHKCLNVSAGIESALEICLQGIFL